MEPIQTLLKEEIHELLLSFAEVGANDVRLKGGDPLALAELKDLVDKIASEEFVSPTLIFIGKVVTLSPLWPQSCSKETSRPETDPKLGWLAKKRPQNSGPVRDGGPFSVVYFRKSRYNIAYLGLGLCPPVVGPVLPATQVSYSQNQQDGSGSGSGSGSMGPD
ncbi:hypothetical protein L6452_07982 [Arctium lappa]|uniref:Uncharacterized protein n=1 Tax=Arctium lappa TaxID=4217 RepID=A0ACB9DG86_ARCLA|nr:hypothetical protein L6452_07982 [Arctium lappa]